MSRNLILGIGMYIQVLCVCQIIQPGICAIEYWKFSRELIVSQIKPV